MSLKNFMFQGHYNVWWKSRFETLQRYLVKDFFKNKTVLDLGSGFGTFAHMIHEQGARVTCSDGRIEYIKIIKERYPHLEVRHEDYEIPFPSDYPYFDVILHFGVVNHMMNSEQHLKSLKDKCEYLFLDCEVIDSIFENTNVVEIETGYDQSLHGQAKYHTEQYYDTLLTKLGFQFIKVMDKSLNTTMHRYNWQRSNSCMHFSQFSHRRLWICSKHRQSIDQCLTSEKTDIDHLFVSFTDKTKELLKDTIVAFSDLQSYLHEKRSRISLFVPKSLLESSLSMFSTHNYRIYCQTPLFINDNYINVMAVTGETEEQELFSFIIQGTRVNENIDIIRNITFKYGRPIDCCWKERELKFVKFEVVKNRYFNRQNIYFQSIGTLGGLNNITTEYAIKFRTDEYYSDIEGFIDTVKSMPEKIITNNVLARKFSKYPYHISDHVIGGTTKNMKLMFEASVNFLKTGKLNGACAEQHLTRCYLEAIGEKCQKGDTPEYVKTLMKNYFHIISIKTMGDYNVTAKSVYKFSLNQNMHTEYSKFVDIECIEDM